MLVGFFASGKDQTITAPSGMTKHWDEAAGTTVEAAADVIQAAAGASGTKTATVAASAAWVGELVALNVACATGSLTLTPPGSISFPGVTLVRTRPTPPLLG